MRDWLTRCHRRLALTSSVAGDQLVGRAVDTLSRDITYALRGLARAPGFTATVVVTLGLGLGANVAMFGVVDRLMYRPLAFLRDPATVHRLYWQWQDASQTRTTRTAAYRRYLDLREGTRAFSALAAFSERDVAVGEGAQAQERRIAAVSASYFEFFDAAPLRGRYFTADEDQPPRGVDVAVIAHDFWQSEFGGREVLGERLVVGEVRATIIGVAPRGFHGVNDAAPPVLWMPITTFAGSAGTNDARTYYSAYAWGWVNVLARRAAHQSVAAASADASATLSAHWRAEREDNPGLRPVAEARPRAIVASVRPGAGPNPAVEERTALWVAGVALLVLLTAGANVGNLVLARALGRQREMAVQVALGASRARLAWQSILECTLLAALGGGCALAVAQWGGTLINRALVRSTTDVDAFADSRSLVVTAGLVLLTGLVLGLVPLVVLRRANGLAGSARSGVRAGLADGQRLRRALLVAQAAFSVVLLVGAALFVRSLMAARAMPLGYDAERVVLVQRVFRGATMTDDAQVAMRMRLLETAQGLADVEAAAWVSSAPFVSTSSTTLRVDGAGATDHLGTFTYQAASPDYFRVMGTRIVRGRPFTTADRRGAPEVMVVSEAMARVLWPGADALGRCVTIARDGEPCRTVIGVAEDMVQQDLASGTRFHFYMPIAQYPRTWGNGMLIKLRGAPELYGERVRVALQQVMPGASYLTMRPLPGIVESARSAWRLGATMFVAFGLLALVVAAVGLYGAIGYDVALRVRELGVRVALGADRAHVLRLIIGQGICVTAAGMAAGLLVAAWSAPWVEPLLFRQSARNPLVYAGAAGVMLVVSLVAGALPALRAARTDPARALRAD